MLFVSILSMMCADCPDPTPAPEFSLKSETVIVYDSRGRALLRAGHDYIADLLDPAAVVQERGYLLLSGEGDSALWVSCADVVHPLCAGGVRPGAQLGVARRSSGIPVCPGDPRCPERPSKKK